MQPPQEIQAIIERTAGFVARMGVDFEKKIAEDEKGNYRFNFLFPQDSYFNYYLSRLGYHRSLLGDNIDAQPPAPPSNASAEQTTKTSSIMDIDGVEPVIQEEIVQEPKRGATYLAQRILATTRQARSRGLSEMAPEQFISDPPSDIRALDMETIKLTAQFVARNGHQFQIGIMNREHKNPQFDFLKQGHFHHPYFLSLVESYTKCLLPPKNFSEKLREDNKDKQSFLDRLILRYNIEKRDADAKRAERDEKERDAMENAAIDWYDFEVVETIDFFDNDYEEQPAGSAASVAPTVKQEEDMDMDMDMDTEEEVKRPPSQMNIRKDYVRSSVKAAAEAARSVKYQVCPKCGMEVPVEEMEQHIKNELADVSRTGRPVIDRSKDAQMASDREITSNLEAFARRRTDIFGGDTSQADRDAEEKKKNEDKVIWDGSATTPRTMSSVMAGKTIDDQIAAIHASKGVSSLPFIPPPPGHGPTSLPLPPGIPGQFMAPPPIFGGNVAPPPGINPMNRLSFQPPPPSVPLGVPPMMMRPTVPVHHQAPPLEQPNFKKQKVEDSLMSEEEFIAKHPGPVIIQVQYAKEGSEKMQGQTVSYTFNLKDTISSVKEKLKEETGIAPNKQKLRTHSIAVLKDQQSLASYNLSSGSVIQFSLKERGGKNK